MGLDMWARSTHYKPEKPTDFSDKVHQSEEISYWRKHPNLHGWMERLYREKGGTAESFNMAAVELTPEDIDRLEADVLTDNLPHTTGFFFGASTTEDRQNDLAFIKAAREAHNNGLTVYYTSWW